MSNDLVLLVRLFVCSSLPPFITKNLGNTSPVLFNFLHEVRRSNGKKLIEPVFMKGHEKPKKSPKWYFCGFDVTLIHSYVLFLFEYEITNVLLIFCPLTFCKSHISGKNLVLDLWSEILKTNQNAQKTSRPITMQNSLVCNVSQAS